MKQKSRSSVILHPSSFLQGSLRIMFAIKPLSHEHETAQYAPPQRVSSRSQIDAPEAQPISGGDSLDSRRIEELPQVLGDPERPGDWVVGKTMKIDHEDPIRPRRYTMNIGTGDEKMAQI